MIDINALVNKIHLLEGERIYAGIGSRQTPPAVCSLMTRIAKKLNERKYVLRSGGALRADRAFEDGAGDLKRIFRKNEVCFKALQLAEEFHPAWHKCGEDAKLLLARNGYQILGKDLDNPVPVKAVVCWTPDGKFSGGTGQALRIADYYEIPIFNLFNILRDGL